MNPHPDDVIGRTIVAFEAEDTQDGMYGFTITLDDGSVLNVAFSGMDGSVEFTEGQST